MNATTMNHETTFDYTTTSDCSIYVASLADYNAGRLHGTWIELTSGMTADDIHDAVAVMLHQSPENTTGTAAEEWAIHDYEGFGEIQLGEWESFDRIIALVEAIEEANENACGEALTAWIADDPSRDPSDFRDHYRGWYENQADYGYELAHDVMSESEIGPLASYVDWDAYGRDLLMDSHWIEASGGGIYVFEY